MYQKIKAQIKEKIFPSLFPREIWIVTIGVIIAYL